MLLAAVDFDKDYRVALCNCPGSALQHRPFGPFDVDLENVGQTQSVSFVEAAVQSNGPNLHLAIRT